MTERAKTAMDFLLWLKCSLDEKQYARCEKLITSHRIKGFYREVAKLEKNGII